MRPECPQAEVMMPDSRNDNLEYIAEMLAELRRMPEGEHAATLAYLLEMAFLEAHELLNDNKPSGDGPDKRDAVA